MTKIKFIEAKEWDDIYGKDKESIHFKDKYLGLQGGIRVYKEKVYMKIENGWILLDDMIKALNSLLSGEEE